jgi:6-phosphofructokinase 1
VPQDVLHEAQRNFQKLDLDALVCIGGDGSLTIAQQLFEVGVPVVGIPKTIDNDLDATMMTFGFESAVSCAVDALDRLHTTAESHDRVMVLEVMGRYAGWLHTTAESHDRVMVLEVMGRYAGWIAASAGIAGGADVILIPEIPFNYDSIVARIHEREEIGKDFSIVIVAEGAREKGSGYVTSYENADEGEARLGGIGQVVADQIQQRTGKETRAVVLGHLQRGGSPSAWDRHLCTRFGVSAVEAIADGMYGHMVALTLGGIEPVKILDAIDRIRTVPPDGELVRTGRALGVSFGSE